jgi:hypothetical protein
LRKTLKQQFDATLLRSTRCHPADDVFGTSALRPDRLMVPADEVIE